MHFLGERRVLQQLEVVVLEDHAARGRGHVLAYLEGGVVRLGQLAALGVGGHRPEVLALDRLAEPAVVPAVDDDERLAGAGGCSGLGAQVRGAGKLGCIKGHPGGAC